MSELVLLGSGGWYPSEKRETTAAAIRTGSQLLLIDGGGGLRRLKQQPELYRDVDRIDILLSHFHQDHTEGLFLLPALGLPVTPTIWGPGGWLYARSTAMILDTLYRRPEAPFPLEAVGSAAHLDAGENLIGGMSVTVRSQNLHSSPTVGFRIGALCWCTDTAYTTETARFAAGARLLAHEAWSLEDEPAFGNFHTSAAGAARIAAEAAVSKLLLVHLNPDVDEKALLAEAKRIFPACELGRDLDRHSF